MSCHFIPPYLLLRLVDHGPQQTAAETLRVDDRLRSRRDQPRATVVPKPAAADGRRVVHTAANTEELPGEVARRDTDPATGDAAVDEAWQWTGDVWDLFAKAFSRQSYDARGSTVTVTVHYGTNYDNAFWDGEQLVFGDGDGEIFDRFTKPLDVLAHEFTHGVVQHTAGLSYQGQPGALNESVADAFAAMTKQRVAEQTADQADWLIGEGIFLPGVQAKALRSMLQPGTAYDDERLGKDPQVANMADYVDTQEDNGGVHVNSGIPNRAFALAAVALGGNSWDRAGRVWYDALTAGEVRADADFQAFAEATVSSARRVFADDPAVATAVVQAWSTVGVLTPASTLTGGQDRTQASSGWAPARVAVRRTGGFAGTVRAGELDLDADPAGDEVRTLLRQIDLRQVDLGSPAPDRFLYTVEYGEVRFTVPEQDLTPQLRRVVQIVLGAPGQSLG